jgi:hypothetical protein
LVASGGGVVLRAGSPVHYGSVAGAVSLGVRIAVLGNHVLDWGWDSGEVLMKEPFLMTVDTMDTKDVDEIRRMVLGVMTVGMIAEMKEGWP